MWEEGEGGHEGVRGRWAPPPAEGKGGKWREANRRRPLQTVTRPGGAIRVVLNNSASPFGGGGADTPPTPPRTPPPPS